MILTDSEKEFLKAFKKKSLISKYRIESKVPLSMICDENRERSFNFGYDRKLIEEVVVDFVVYKGKKIVAAIEIIDEEDELKLAKGERMLIRVLFQMMGYQFYCVDNLDNLQNEAERIIKELNND